MLTVQAPVAGERAPLAVPAASVGRSARTTLDPDLGDRPAGRHVSIRLLLADDQALVRGALAALLDLEPDLEVVAEVGRGDEVVEAAQRTRPDVALLDVEMPGLDGIEATRALRSAAPGVQVLIVTTFGRPGFLRRALQAGANGFVVKDTPARQLADAVRRVHSGLRVVDPALAADSLAVGESPLTAARDRGAAGRARRRQRRRHRPQRVPLGGHGAQPPVRGDRQDLARNRADAVRIADENGWL